MKLSRATFERFATEIATGNIEIYNEFSLQHELGLFLRNETPKSLKVQFERNVSYFGMEKEATLKREIDIVVFSSRGDVPVVALELKYPRNRQYPVQMFNFCKDIAFLESLVTSGFRQGVFVAFADDRLFYKGGRGGKIYDFFRSGRELHGAIPKPPSVKVDEFAIRGKYKIEWEPVCGSLRYATVVVDRSGFEGSGLKRARRGAD